MYENHSLDEYYEDYNDIPLIDENFQIYDLLFHRSLKEEINIILNSLTERESMVLQMRFGLNGDGDRTLDEIGSYLNLTRERIRQIERKAIRKLNRSSIIKNLEYYL